VTNHINAWVALEGVREIILKAIPYVPKNKQLELKTALKHIRKVEMILENFIN